tara:strand:- start:1642 stop:2268 length:627 start_codon:yes stop_codon:yes gene_type:complete
MVTATVQNIVLGEVITKFTMPQQFVDDLNKVYDESKILPDWNIELAGKIKEEKLINPVLSDAMRGTFLMCFQHYLKGTGSVLQKTHRLQLDNAWVNEMKANEYNPAHFHASKKSLVGMSSVLFLKVPDTYGPEYSNAHEPSNGHLEFIGGSQHSLSISQYRINPKVGDFFIFPYTLVHTVYPFNGTDQVRRTLSYNCDILTKETNAKE